MQRLGRAAASLPVDGSNGVVLAMLLGSETLRLGNALINVVRPMSTSPGLLRILLREYTFFLI
jgi:hypothetical protein